MFFSGILYFYNYNVYIFDCISVVDDNVDSDVEINFDLHHNSVWNHCHTHPCDDSPSGPPDTQSVVLITHHEED